MYICSLSGIHNTSLLSGHFGLDKRECERLEYFFYDIHGRKGVVLFFCSVPDTIRDSQAGDNDFTTLSIEIFDQIISMCSRLLNHLCLHLKRCY
jgi:hypothetical protein